MIGIDIFVLLLIKDVTSLSLAEIFKRHLIKGEVQGCYSEPFVVSDTAKTPPTSIKTVVKLGKSRSPKVFTFRIVTEDSEFPCLKATFNKLEDTAELDQIFGSQQGCPTGRSLVDTFSQAAKLADFDTAVLFDVSTFDNVPTKIEKFFSLDLSQQPWSYYSANGFDYGREHKAAIAGAITYLKELDVSKFCSDLKQPFTCAPDIPSTENSKKLYAFMNSLSKSDSVRFKAILKKFFLVSRGLNSVFKDGKTENAFDILGKGQDMFKRIV